MRISSHNRGPYVVLKVEQVEDKFPDLSRLKDVIAEKIEQGVRHVAVNFEATSYIYSGELRIIVSCYNMLRECEGTLHVIEPNQAAYDVLKVLNIDRLIDIVTSEESLPEIVGEQGVPADPGIS